MAPVLAHEGPGSGVVIGNNGAPHEPTQQEEQPARLGRRKNLSGSDVWDASVQAAVGSGTGLACSASARPKSKSLARVRHH
jgi:hypothetical protein